MKAKLKQGEELSLGCDHPNYPVPLTPIAPDVLVSLLDDLI
jgi:hypothetical protein